MRYRPRWMLAAAALLAVASAPAAEEEPATSAASRPARERQVLKMPPGFKTVESRGFTVLYLPEDEAWVQRAIGRYAPATRPATMPQTLLQRIAEKRAEVETQIRRDFALNDDASLAPLFDAKILPELRRLEEYSVPVFYLVTHNQQLRDMIKSGQWSHPSFYYNRAADEVIASTKVPLNLSGPADDTVLPVTYLLQSSPAEREEKLLAELQNSQLELLRIISGKCQHDLHIAIGEFILRELLTPLKLPADQRWFAVGAAAYASCDYAETLTGGARRELLAMMLFDNYRNRVPIAAVDVLRPADPATVKPQLLPAYRDTFRRKSILLVRKWLEKGGRESLPRVMATIRGKRPENAASLLELIKKDSGIDLAADAAAK